MNSEIVVREACMDDGLAIVKISKDDLGYACEEKLVKTKLASINCNRECVFVAVFENKVVGYVHIELYNVLYMETLANILGLAVSSKNRRMGAGHMLMSKAEEWAKRKGAVGVRLNSGSTRADAHQFYRAIGYEHEKGQIRFLKLI